MKIVSCFTKIDEIEPLIEAGASELYFGLDGVPSFGNGNLKSLNEAETAISMAHENGLTISMAVNSPEIFKSLEKTISKIKKLDQMGVDGIIAANPTLIMKLHELKKHGQLKTAVQLSSVQPCFNYSTVQFFKRFGITRVILPNQLTPDEAEKIITNSQIETEVFDPRFFGCPFINGRCKLHFNILIHDNNSSISKNIHPCSSDHDSDFDITIRPVLKKVLSSEVVKDLGDLIRQNCKPGWGERLVSYAAIFDYYVQGVDYIKYGTRPDPTKLKLEKVHTMRRTLDFLNKVTKEYEHDEAKHKFMKFCK